MTSRTLQNVGLVVLGVFVAFTCAEGAYRIKLSGILPSSATFGGQNLSLWEFHREFGYVYPPNRAVAMFWISSDGVVSCHEHIVNPYGNIGRVKGEYESAELKVLVFGDSFSATAFQGMTWPDHLQDRLEDRLKRSVHVVNFGRDGYGVLQMFDLAKAKVPEWQPDLVVFAFISDDLTRARFWRAVVKVDGLTRVLVTRKPTPRPAIEDSADVYLLYPDANIEWCLSMKGTGQRDAHVEEIERIRQRLRNDRIKQLGFLSLDRSFLYKRIRHGHPFYPAGNNPRHQLNDLMDDERFREALAVLGKSSVPVVLVHLPFYSEYVANKYLLNDTEARLRESLERTGHQFVSLLDPDEPPLENPERIRNSPSDFHPSSQGLELYAEQVAAVLMDHLESH